MSDYKYKFDFSIPDAKTQREQVTQQGIGARPADEQEPMDKGFYESMYDAIVAYFDDSEEADRVLTAKEIDKDRVKGEVLREFDALDSLLSEDTETPSLDYFDGIDRDVMEDTVQAQADRIVDTAGATFEKPSGELIEGFKDVTDTEEGKLTNVKPLEELAEAIDPGTIDTSELPGKGLMSPRLDDKGVTSFYNPDVVTKEGRVGLKEAQKVLAGLGYYKSSIDGVTGANTSNAIKVYQYDNGLEVTGELDDSTKKKLAEGGTAVPKPENELLASISEHEGGYGAANNGTSRLAKKFSVSGTYYSDNYNKPLTEMTVNEILNAQNGTTGKTDVELLELDPESRTAQRNREFFAVGAYQIIPITMKKALQDGAISGDEVFSPELQDRIALQFLAGSDKPKLRDYIRGEEGASLDDAAMALAEQWASFPVPRDVTNAEGEVIATTGSSRYGSGNRALHDLTSTKNMLKSVRAAFKEQVQTAVP